MADVLALADSATPEQLAQLADLEWRSRLAAGDFYYEACDELVVATDKHVELWRGVFTRAQEIALRLYPDTHRELVVISAIEHAALAEHHLIVPLIGPGTRMYLGRAWRTWVKEVLSS